MFGLRSRRLLGRCADRVDDQTAARAGKPDINAIPSAIQFSAPLVLSDECHKRIEGFRPRHGAPSVDARLPLLRGRGARV